MAPQRPAFPVAAVGHSWQVDPMGDDPIAQVRAFLAEHDPDVLAAVADVDRGLIGNMLELSPMERLHRAVQTAYELDAMAASLRAARSVA